jgi:hypothetical protein
MKPWILMLAASSVLLLAGCAYYRDGASTRLSLIHEPGKTLLLNGKKIEDSVTEVEIADGRDYRHCVEGRTFR